MKTSIFRLSEWATILGLIALIVVAGLNERVNNKQHMD